MDSALLLRSLVDSGNGLSNSEIQSLLQNSKIVNQIISDVSAKPLPNVWRLVALSEIPFSNQLKYTKKLIDYFQDTLFTGNGYSFDKNNDSLLTCYNAMITGSLIKLGCLDNYIKRSIEWILEYQPINKHYHKKWEGSASKKYGGCFNNTPCYIGVVKNIKTLVQYNRHIQDSVVEKRITDGIEYLLEHELLFRLSNGEPITKHILDISFPESYNLNCIELLLLIFEVGKIKDNRAEKLINYLKSKKIKNEYWKINYSYKAEGYICFDSKGVKAEWVTYLVPRQSNLPNPDRSFCHYLPAQVSRIWLI
ncbi:MAG: hypothetical protein JXR70_14655, partial [Spirochaetales bacterium]|nr:hypothetical protein [Spirochaetales bacterium]